jgi:hypothetical protein
MSPFSPPIICPIALNQIRKISKQHGYYLAVCDFSQYHFIAIPWITNIEEPEVLIKSLFETLKPLFEGIPIGPELKPHNRISWTVTMYSGLTLDISVILPHGTVYKINPAIEIEM